MAEHTQHEGHSHEHASGCGHKAVQHDGHVDYLHDGHLHRAHGDHVDECSVEVAAANPAACTPQHACGGHADGHRHAAACGHDMVPHGDHTDYVVAGHLHHPHGAHCDDHGAIALT